MSKISLHIIILLLISMSFLGCSNKKKSSLPEVPSKVTQAEVNTPTESNSKKKDRGDPIQRLLIYVNNNDNKNAEILIGELLDNPNYEKDVTRIVFTDLSDFTVALLQTENKSELIEKLYKSGFKLAIERPNNYILYKVLETIIEAAFIQHNYVHDIKDTKVATQNDYKEQIHIRTDALKAILGASKDTREELTKALKLNPDFSFYEKNINDEIFIKARYFRTSYISFLNYYLTPLWWINHTSDSSRERESRLATFFRMISIVKTINNLQEYADTFSLDSMKNIYVYGNAASRSIFRDLIKHKIELLNQNTDIDNSSKDAHSKYYIERIWLENIEVIGLFSSKGFSGESMTAKNLHNYYPGSLLDKGSRVSYNSNPCFKELTYFAVNSVAVDFDGDCIEDGLDFDIDDDGTANALDSHPFNQAISFDDVDNDQIPDHLDWEVNNVISTGHNLEDATYQKKIFKITSYLIQDGNSQFKSEEVSEIYKLFINYQLLYGFKDSLISIVKVKNLGTDTAHGSYVESQKVLKLYDALFEEKTEDQKNKLKRSISKECVGREIPKLQIYQTLLHEFAHIVEAHDETRSINDPSYKSKIRTFLHNMGWFFYPNPTYLTWHSIILFEDFDDTTISDYGPKNASEYFAELFSAAVLLSKPWIEVNYNNITPDDLCYNIKAFMPNLYNCRNLKPEVNSNDNKINCNIFKPLLEIIDLVEYDEEWRKNIHLDSNQLKNLIIPFLDKYKIIYGLDK